MNPTSWRWNLFAREVEDQLLAHQLTWNDLGRVAGVQREEIRRLRRSLVHADHFPVFSVAEMERWIQGCPLEPEETRRLRAAMVVASIQRLIFRRIAPDQALAAAEEILPIMSRVMTLAASSNIRIDDAPPDPELDTSLDVALTDVFAMIDRATSDLIESRASLRKQERVQLARAAWYEFHLALTALHTYTPTPSESTDWTLWQHIINEGLEQVKQRLANLGTQAPAVPIFS